MKKSNELRLKIHALEDAERKIREIIYNEVNDEINKITEELYQEGIKVWDEKIGIKLPVKLDHRGNEKDMVWRVLNEVYDVPIPGNEDGRLNLDWVIRDRMGISAWARNKFDRHTGRDYWYTEVERKPVIR